MKRQKEKQKSLPQKEYEILKSIHDQIQEELYCLKKQEDIILKLIQAQQKRLKSSQKISLASSQLNTLQQEETPMLESKQQYELRSKPMIFSSSHDQMDIAASFFYTGQKIEDEPMQTRRTVKKEDIFKMDEELYEEDDDNCEGDYRDVEE